MNTIEYSCGHQVAAHSGQAMPMQCDCGMGEIVGAKGQFYMSDKMIRSMREAAMSAKPLQSPEWNGSDPIMPSVGTKCEAVWLEAPDGGSRDFEPVIIKGYYKKQVWFCTVDGEDLTHLLANVDFRPVRTRAQTEREELLTSVVEDYRKSFNSPVSTVELNLISEFANYLFEIGMLREAGE